MRRTNNKPDETYSSWTQDASAEEYEIETDTNYKYHPSWFPAALGARKSEDPGELEALCTMVHRKCPGRSVEGSSRPRSKRKRRRSATYQLEFNFSK
jgi:hypothetical protein